MMRSLFTKTLYDKRWFIFGWAIALLATVVLTVAFFPSFNQGDTFEELSRTVPDQLKGFIGDAATFHTLDGYVAEQLYNIRIPIMFMIMALILALGLTVSDEEKGTLRTTTILPLSRTRILLERWLAGAVVFGVVTLVAITGCWVGAYTIHETLSFDFIWRIFVLTWLFGISAFSIMFAAGIASGSRGLTMIIGLFITLGSFLLTTFSMSVEWLKGWELLSLMHYSDTHSILQNSLDRLHIWVLVLLTVLSILIAIIFFRRRDIS